MSSGYARPNYYVVDPRYAMFEYPIFITGTDFQTLSKCAKSMLTKHNCTSRAKCHIHPDYCEDSKIIGVLWPPVVGYHLLQVGLPYFRCR